MKAVQALANKHARLRDCHGDEGAGCISCPLWFPFEGGDGGHFVPGTMYSALRYDERNINFQCHRCNRYLRANLHNYYVGIVKKWGQEVADELMERQHETKKWTREELEDLKVYYKAKIADLKAGISPDTEPVTILDIFAGS